MSLLRSAYNVVRSLVMSVIVLLALLYIGLYVILSLPLVQDRVKARICKEASLFLGGDLVIRKLSVSPFSEVRLSDVVLISPEGEECVGIGDVAAGIDIWKLVTDRKIVLNYAEIIGLDLRISQKSPDSPLNIKFLIDALSPKDGSNPSVQYDLKIRNVVVRDSKVSFSRLWMKDSVGVGSAFADMVLDRLRMDLSIPEISNSNLRFDVRKIQFDMTPGLKVRSLSADVSFIKDASDGGGCLMIKGLELSLPHSTFAVGNLDLRLDSLSNIGTTIEGVVTPADFASLLPEADSFDTPWTLAVDASLKGKRIEVAELMLHDVDSGSSVALAGAVGHYDSRDSLEIDLEALDINLSAGLISDVIRRIPKVNDGLRSVMEALGDTGLKLQGALHSGGEAEADGKVFTDSGSVDFKVFGSRLYSRKPVVRFLADAQDVDLDRLASSAMVGRISASMEGEVEGFDRNAEGWLKLRSDECTVMGNSLAGIDLELNKTGPDLDLTLDMSSREMHMNLDGEAHLAGENSRISADLDIEGFNPAAYGVKGKLADCDLTARVSVDAVGDNVDNVTGRLSMRDISIRKPDGRHLDLADFRLSVDASDSIEIKDRDVLIREVRVNSDWLDAMVSGRILPGSLLKDIRSMLAAVLPTLLPESSIAEDVRTPKNDFVFDLDIKGAAAPYVFFDLPVRPLTNIPVSGYVDGSAGKLSLSLATPHLLQGKNKIISDVRLGMDMDSNLGMAKIGAGLVFPAKKGDAELSADIYALHDKVNVNIGINPTRDSSVKGNIALSASFLRMPDPFDPGGALAVTLNLLPSSVVVGGKPWLISEGNVDYSGNRISVGNILIGHENQYVSISGTASESPDDYVRVVLNDIDLEYIFGILNINYVSFGGMASGEVRGSRLLTKTPEARTEFLRVKGLSYNGAVLGDGDLASDYDASSQKIGIYAVIRDPLTRQRRVSVDGGIWVTKDSLSFGFDADRVNVGIMKPFVSAFCSDIYGSASGKCKLFGTFTNVDLTGALKADTLSMKLDFTNTWYHAGEDSVFLYKGVIDIPPLTLYDDEKHTAEFSGWLRHNYFHDPSFNFRVKDAKSLLCYNTNERINPLWYGTIYGTGHAQINGYPGLIDIDMNMTTEEGSKFYYVISDTEDVAQSSFLSFTDRRKAGRLSADKDSVPDYLKRFRKQSGSMESGSSNVILSLKGTVTNDAFVTLVLDPKAGDNITARGQGALQMDYNMAANDLRMIGTYVLDEGNYNFTLQDIIIKNFNIRRGSLIKFDGDPMKATLDIAATYRVNTNLTDLDESFSTDKELNRTNVPVDAVLLVDGPMTNPDITFDIELPSLTSDVERKVKSIVSTNDMMSRQIIYLLALNRFYTPEYTGAQSTGGEWSSVASSTISSQLSNILSQMTDKLDVAPSFRSDKGDFTDMEFDLALSSRLLNNRLLINGNFGYRDRSTSNTQFVGDFDIEYLLNKSGNLRLKAYNHFNDQNYYLRSALTTQGVGVVFRKDFDRLFRRKKKLPAVHVDVKPDSIPQEMEDGMIVKEESTTDSIRDIQ